MQEAVLDLAVEQALAPALTRVNGAFVQVMLEQGIPLEAIVTELVLSGEVERTMRLVREAGYAAQFEYHSPTSQYGQVSRRDEYDDVDVDSTMRAPGRRHRVGSLRRRVGRRARRRLPEPRAVARAVRRLARARVRDRPAPPVGQGAVTS